MVDATAPQEVRDLGYAASFEERDTGAASISAPVFGMSGELTAVLGIGAPTQRDLGVHPAQPDPLAPPVAGHPGHQRAGEDA